MANDPLRPEIWLIRQRGPTPPQHLAGPRPNAFDRAFSHGKDPQQAFASLSWAVRARRRDSNQPLPPTSTRFGAATTFPGSFPKSGV
jgi:hypothetical protein